MNSPFSENNRLITKLAKQELVRQFGWGYRDYSDWIFEYIEIFMTIYMRDYTSKLKETVMMKPSINYLPDPIAPSVVIQLTDEQIRNLEIE